MLPPTRDATRRGHEGFLVVDDEGGVRKLITEILKQNGFHVFAAADGLEAVAIVNKYLDDIALLLTDITMPHMTGPRLAERALTIAPHLKVIFMSGYTENAMIQQDTLSPNSVFLSKPFTSEALLGIIRNTLDPVRVNL